MLYRELIPRTTHRTKLTRTEQSWRSQNKVDAHRTKLTLTEQSWRSQNKVDAHRTKLTLTKPSRRSQKKVDTHRTSWTLTEPTWCQYETATETTRLEKQDSENDSQHHQYNNNSTNYSMVCVLYINFDLALKQKYFSIVFHQADVKCTQYLNLMHEKSGDRL